MGFLAFKSGYSSQGLVVVDRAEGSVSAAAVATILIGLILPALLWDHGAFLSVQQILSQDFILVTIVGFFGVF